MSDDEEVEIEEMRRHAAEYREAMNLVTARRYARMLANLDAKVHIELTPFTADHYGTMTIGKWGGWLIQIVPMGFNDRLVLTPGSFPAVYDYGWCYDKGAAAFLAALLWDPATEAEPQGFKKRINRVPRKAGETAHGCSQGIEAAAGLLGAVDAIGTLLGVDQPRD